ncbi:MAG: glycosyl hydrolase family 28-related protein [Planctomycetota bacterium]|jgi:hypothetical protein|nr:glycosyl hydrolase family 28-related protein [Planctomycetota bacterium]
MFRYVTIVLVTLAFGALPALETPLSLAVNCDTPPAAEPLPGGFTVTPDGAITQSTETVAPWIYDPASGRSRANGGAWACTGEGPVARIEGDWSPLRDMTIECYVRVDVDPKRDMMPVIKTRVDSTGGVLGAGPRYLKRWKQTYWSGLAAAPGGEVDRWSSGHYVSISRIQKNTVGWRHLAVVYRAADSSVSCYVDHWQVKTHSLPAAMVWDAGALLIGGDGAGAGFTGLIDEVRVTAAALEPAQFLRASQVELRDVDFTSPETVLPKGTGYIDLRAGFGAIGDGQHDDTAAFQKAFAELSNKVPASYHTLYIPPGTYVVRDLLQSSRFLVVQGAGVDQTTIKLADATPGFDNPKKPQAVWRASSTSGPPGSNKAVNGSSIGLYIFDLAIDTGTGNPGATGLEYHSNNHGTVARVAIRSGDGAGYTGLDLTHKTNGPALITDVSIDGFDYGVRFDYQEYSMTLERVQLRGQRVCGIHNKRNIMALRNITSDNSVPALISEGGESMISLLDSEFRGGAADQAAIRSEGALYARSVTIAGYGTSIAKRRVTFHGWKAKPNLTSTDDAPVTGNIDEYVSDVVVGPAARRGDGMPLKMAIEDAPAVPWGDIQRDWVSIQSFADRKDGDDWTPAIQAAIDSGAATVYFPQGAYPMLGTVTLQAPCRRLFGMKSKLFRPKDFIGEEPLVVFAGKANTATAIERLDIAHLHCDGAGTLVTHQASPRRLTNAAGAGKLFMYDVTASDVRLDHPQQVWVRQWNPELHGDGPCVISRGASIWSLGFKTEYESSKLWALDGAKTEIYGGFIYPVVKGIPKERPVFKNVDSDMSVIYGQSVYSAGHNLQVWEQRGDERQDFTYEDGKWVKSRFRIDLYVSKGE